MIPVEKRAKIENICKLNLSRQEKLQLLMEECDLTLGAANAWYYRCIPRDNVTVYQKSSKVIAENCQDMLEVISRNPQNLQHAFRVIGHKYNLNPLTVSKSWYGNGEYKNNPLNHARNNGKVFLLCGDSAYVNRKNCTADHEVKSSVIGIIKNLFKRVKND